MACWHGKGWVWVQRLFGFGCSGRVASEAQTVFETGAAARVFSVTLWLSSSCIGAFDLAYRKHARPNSVSLLRASRSKREKEALEKAAAEKLLNKDVTY